MRKLVCVIVCLSMLAGLCACTHTAEVLETPPEISDEDLYAVDMEEKAWPVIDGSAAFLPYYTAAAARLLEVSEEEASRSVRCSTTEFAYRSDLWRRGSRVLLPPFRNDRPPRFP